MNVLAKDLTVEPNESSLALLKQVSEYHHPGVIHKLMTVHGMMEEEASVLFNDTKQFLYLCGVNPGNSYGPSLRIDIGWHEFILHTRDYMNFCEKFFGRYLHHMPNKPGSRRDALRPQRTLHAAIEIFDVENLSDNWNYPNMSGEDVLGPRLLHHVEATDPCGESCGCDASCNHD